MTATAVSTLYPRPEGPGFTVRVDKDYPKKPPNGTETFFKAMHGLVCISLGKSNLVYLVAFLLCQVGLVGLVSGGSGIRWAWWAWWVWYQVGLVSGGHGARWAWGHDSNI